MNREFLDFYNRELSLLREQAEEFAREYPGVAERLGGLMSDRLDPMIAGLLEGAAFLAARVQLKLKHEFADFTTNLIDQLAPHYLAPTPSFLLAQVQPKFGDPALREGRTIARGAYLDAAYRELERNVACRFRLTAPIALWPFEIARAEYFTSAGPLQALGLPLEAECAAGLRLQLTVRATPSLEDEPADKEAQTRPELRFSACRVKDLRFHMLGHEADAIALYEQIFAHCRGVYFRFLDAFGDPVVVAGERQMVRQIGFGEDEALIPNDKRLFRGFDFLRDYFAFPRRFLGFDLTNLASVVPRLAAKSVDVVLAFDEINPRLAAAVRKEFFALYAAPAVNLFEKTVDRIAVKSNQHEYAVVPDRSHPLDFEPNRVLNVFAHIPGAPQKVPVEPLYSAAAGRSPSGLCYTVRRLPRRRTAEERKYGQKSDYTGTDMFLSLGERSDPAEVSRVAELSVQALCTNRHLTEHLPVGDGGADFRFLDNVDLDVRCVAGPTRPREPTMTGMVGRTDGASTGDVAWRVVSMLSLNHLGLVERAAGDGARSLREMLALFADMSDSATERKIRGLRSLDARPVVRRMRQPQGAAAARGLEVEVLIDDKAYEGSGAFLMGAVLDRFFAEYVAINHFTQVVVRTNERGEIMRWPPRPGMRGVS
ncbi:MAG TPA: type VI secretion system baseplate subunit TssF [Roseiarcus sp.]|jgi:type VI secretion system protein ImpG